MKMNKDLTSMVLGGLLGNPSFHIDNRPRRGGSLFMSSGSGSSMADAWNGTGGYTGWLPPSGGGGGGAPSPPPPPAPPAAPRWAFPEYTQTWAFTPPEPQWYPAPPPFNKANYASSTPVKK